MRGGPHDADCLFEVTEREVEEDVGGVAVFEAGEAGGLRGELPELEGLQGRGWCGGVVGAEGRGDGEEGRDDGLVEGEVEFEVLKSDVGG